MEQPIATFVDRLASQRAWISIVLGAIAATRSTSVFIFNIGNTGMEVTVTDGLGAIAGLAWVVILLLFALFAGGLWLSTSLRRRLNDENTLANWRATLVTGFWAMMLGAAICLVAVGYMPLTARAAVQVMVALGVGMTLIRFGGLERRALEE